MKYTPYTLKKVKDSSASKKFTVISTFAGGGGSSTGYRLAGGNILAINEFIEEARNTYHDNYPDTPILPDDIKNLTGQDLLDAAGIKKGELDILDGSPPCSAFSVSGKTQSGWGQTKSYSDGAKVSNIEDLFFEFLRCANDIRPKVIVGENVKGLTIGEPKKIYLPAILKEFENIGYDVAFKVLDSRYYGVSQTRARVIFIGTRRDVTEKLGLCEMTLPSVFPRPDTEVLPLEEVTKGLVQDPEEVAMLTEKWINTAYYKITASKMPNDPPKVLSGRDYHPKKHHFNLKKCSRFAPAPTLTAMGGSMSSAGPIHWNETRKLTIGELKRIMTLPDDFKLTGKWNQQAERIGRMVPPIMMQRIATAIYENVLRPYNHD